MCISSKHFGGKFNTIYTKSMNDNKIDNDECNEKVQIYEEYNRIRKIN